MATFKRTSHKYGAQKTKSDGYSFASTLERNVYWLLKAMEQKGEIKIEQVQDQIELSAAKIIYKPDFRITDLTTNETIWVEAKGFETPEWRIKLRLWKKYGPGKLRIYKGSGANIFLHEEINGGNENG